MARLAAGRASPPCHACLPAHFPSLLACAALGCRYGPKLQGVEAFVWTGEGTVEAVIKAAKEQRAAEQARQQRSQEIDALLAAEGLQHQRCGVPGLEHWVETGEDYDKEELVAAARRAEEEQGQLMQRRQAMQELLAAEGLEKHLHSKGVDAWVSRGEGSEAEALAAARQAAPIDAGLILRFERLLALMTAEGIEWEAVGPWAPDIQAWMCRKEGSEKAAMAVARRAWKPVRERKLRRTRLMAALKADGLKFDAEARGSWFEEPKSTCSAVIP